MRPTAYFDDLYTADPDPWKLASSAYEQRKLALLLACLPRRRYSSAFEPGCAIGVTTTALAARCDHVLAMDCADAAVEQARLRTRGLAVEVVGGSIPRDWPAGAFDLLVISELLYYLDAEERQAVTDLAAGSLAAGGDLVAVHWRPRFHEAATSGDEAHRELEEGLLGRGHVRLVTHIEDRFLLAVFRKAR